MLRHTFVAFAIFAAGISVAAAETPVERAGYLVNAVMACDGCHTPRGPQGFDMSKRFSGGSQVWDEAAYTVRGSNITPDRDTGIDGWTEEQIADYLESGNRPDGDVAGGLMAEVIQGSSAGYKDLTKADRLAIAKYLKSIPAVKNKID